MNIKSNIKCATCDKEYKQVENCKDCGLSHIIDLLLEPSDVEKLLLDKNERKYNQKDLNTRKNDKHEEANKLSADLDEVKKKYRQCVKEVSNCETEIKNFENLIVEEQHKVNYIKYDSIVESVRTKTEALQSKDVLLKSRVHETTISLKIQPHKVDKEKYIITIGQNTFPTLMLMLQTSCNNLGATKDTKYFIRIPEETFKEVTILRNSSEWELDFSFIKKIKQIEKGTYFVNFTALFDKKNQIKNDALNSKISSIEIS